ASIRIIGDARVEEPPQEILSFMESDNLLIVTKANSRSKIHRPVWLDYIGLKIFDKEGKLCGELRIVGLFTSSAYTRSISQIPFLKEKAKTIIQRLGYNRADYSGKALISVLETYPRDEMFRSDVDTLTENVKL
ncbi:NAD-glutamate dehydrogenase domain-containing protein, partial [Bartonella grahamii]